MSEQRLEPQPLGDRVADSIRRTSVSGPRVLLVDDDQSVRRAAARVLQAEGFAVTQAADGEEALRLIEKCEFDVVLTDVMMPRTSGLELLRAIRQRDLELPVILMTGMPSMEAAREAQRFGALHYLTKPVDNDRLVSAVTRAERLRRLAIVKRIAMDVVDSLLPRAGDRAGLEHSLDQALETLWMAYQPIVHASTHQLYGFEALMRSREASLPHPGAVLDAAERTGRLYDVGRRVRDLSPGPLPFAPPGSQLLINLHSADLADPMLVAPDSALARVAPRVILEITERATLEGLDGVERRVAQLREMGFRIAIDDLGAGYAGLTSFAWLEPEVVKLDMTLIRDVEKSSTKRKLIGSIVGVCHDLGVQVVAEGIETVAERDVLVELECDLLQGYLLGRPGEPFPSFAWGG
jgi:EAL domain-containing protein (putative c-di-GMP-specific phosphodiesterase class I)/CheY-like chemotaxis protein